MKPILKIFADSGCQAYLIGCPTTKKALLVDAKAGKAATYDKALKDFGLTLAAAIDTHTHADHLSDSSRLLRTGCPVYMSRHTKSRRAVTRVGEGDQVKVGDLTFTVREVPGHTPDSVALIGHGMVIAGDTIFAGSLARTDFRGSSAAEMYDSVMSKIMVLPDDTVILPGHDYKGILFTTVGVERKRNPAFRFASAAAYAASTGDVEGRGNSPDVDAMLRINLEKEPILPIDAQPAAACCMVGGGDASASEIHPREQSVDKLAPERERYASARHWFDVRDPHEYAKGHIPGALNLPLSELGFHLDEIRACPEAVFSCQGGVRSLTAAKTLMYLGAIDDPISMAGGFAAWQASGQQVEMT